MPTFSYEKVGWVTFFPTKKCGQVQKSEGTGEVGASTRVEFHAQIPINPLVKSVFGHEIGG
jgi:hypothetical protein